MSALRIKGVNRPSIQEKIVQVVALTKAGRTVGSACREVGVSPSTYYADRNTSKAPRFPAIESDWIVLTETYKPREFDELDDRERLSLAKTVGETFKTIFSRPVYGLTPTQRSHELRKLLDRSIALIETFDGLGYDARRELSILEEQEVKGLIAPAIERVRTFVPVIESKANDLAVARTMRPSDLGGPRTDPRTLAVTTRLSDIFTRHSGKLPTHRTSHYTGKPISQFNRFAIHAFQHFLGAQVPPKRALRDAMQHVAARLDWTDVAEGRDE
jgi:hypothetical protein